MYSIINQLYAPGWSIAIHNKQSPLINRYSTVSDKTTVDRPSEIPTRDKGQHFWAWIFQLATTLRWMSWNLSSEAKLLILTESGMGSRSICSPDSVHTYCLPNITRGVTPGLQTVILCVNWDIFGQGTTLLSMDLSTCNNVANLDTQTNGWNWLNLVDGDIDDESWSYFKQWRGSYRIMPFRRFRTLFKIVRTPLYEIKSMFEQ